MKGGKERGKETNKMVFSSSNSRTTVIRMKASDVKLDEIESIPRKLDLNAIKRRK